MSFSPSSDESAMDTDSSPMNVQPEVVPFVTQRLLEQYVAHLEKWLSYGNRMMTKYASTYSAHDSFCGERLHRVTLGDYLKRITQHGYVDDDCLIHSLYYINRLIQFRSNPGLITPFGRPVNFLHDGNIHRIVACTMMIASKYQLDKTWSFSGFAGIFGLGVPELKRLEMNFVAEIDWDLYLPQDVEKQQLAQLETYSIPSTQ
jgi:hypothetical protein